MSRETPRAWYAVDCSADMSPPLLRLRTSAGPYADALYFRALAFCKLYAQQGELENSWTDLAGFVRWPDSSEDLRDLFRATGLATAPRDRLYLWYESNGWIIRARAADAAKHRALRMKAKRHAKAQRDRRAANRAPVSLLGGRLVGRVTGTSAGPSPGTLPGRHRDVPGTRSEQKNTEKKGSK